MCFELCHAIFTGFLPCIFVIYVVTSTSMQSSLRDVAVFRDLGFCCHFPAVILMPCNLDATVRSMLILRCFSKDVLNMWLFSIHSCPWVQLWSALECLLLALLLLSNVPGGLVTC